MKLKSSQYMRSFDWVILGIIGVLVGFSLLLMAHAGFNPFADSGETGFLGVLSRIDFYYVFLQAAWFLIGLVVMTAMVMIDYHTMARWGKLIYLINVLVLALLLALGKTTRGIQGWITFGERAFQPAEVYKITCMIFIGKLLAQKSDMKNGAPLNFNDILPSLIYFAVPFVLVLMQPDFGTAMVYVASYIGMLLYVKIEKKLLITGIAVLVVVSVAGWFLLADWQKARVTGFISGDGVDQVESSKVLIGSGRLFGKGFFQEGTLASLDFLAEQHTDFIFALAVETTGFVGGFLIIALYFGLMFRMVYLMRQSTDTYGSLLIAGVLFMFIAHIFENVAMTMGIMPVTGIPAPFLSYGGSAMLTNMMAIGLVECVAVRRNKPYYAKL